MHLTFDPQDFKTGQLNMPHWQKLVGHGGSLGSDWVSNHFLESCHITKGFFLQQFRPFQCSSPVFQSSSPVHRFQTAMYSCYPEFVEKYAVKCNVTPLGSILILWVSVTLEEKYDCLEGELLSLVWTKYTYHISCSLTFYSLYENKISVNGSCILTGAMQLDQRLQKLVWVQLFMSS